MINLSQIQSLEQKVVKAVELIDRLREENEALRAKLKSAQPKIHELEAVVHTYKQEQEAIEKSILNVLSKLDKLEDEVSAPASSSKKVGPKTVLRDDGDATAAGDKAGPAGAGGSAPMAVGAKVELDIF